MSRTSRTGLILKPTESVEIPSAVYFSSQDYVQWFTSESMPLTKETLILFGEVLIKLEMFVEMEIMQ